MADVEPCSRCGAPGDRNWFDRTVCAEPCGDMHTRCEACGAALGGCLLEAEPDRYSGPATLRAEGQAFDVQAVLSTNTAHGTYSWYGRLVTPDVAALALRGQGGTLTLSVPGEPSGEVGVVVADPGPDGGVLLRIHGAGRAPYGQDGEIT